MYFTNIYKNLNDFIIKVLFDTKTNKHFILKNLLHNYTKEVLMNGINNINKLIFI